MARWPIIFLQLSSIILLSTSCAYNKLKNGKTLQAIQLTTEVIQPVIPSNKQSVKYKAEIDVLTKHFTGIVVLKQTDEKTAHIVFVTELGMRMFDFSVVSDSVKADFVFEALNKPKFVTMLTQSFREMLLINAIGKTAELKENKKGNYYWIKDHNSSIAIPKSTTTFAEKTQVFTENKKHSATKYQTNYSVLNYKTKGLVKLKINLIKIEETK